MRGREKWYKASQAIGCSGIVFIFFVVAAIGTCIDKKNSHTNNRTPVRDAYRRETRPAAWRENARAERVRYSLGSAVAYLRSVDDVAWVEVDRNNVYVGFDSQPDDWRAIINGAALAGNQATGFGCHVWATGEPAGWRPGRGSYYGETTARDGRIER